MTREFDYGIGDYFRDRLERGRKATFQEYLGDVEKKRERERIAIGETARINRTGRIH